MKNSSLYAVAFVLLGAVLGAGITYAAGDRGQTTATDSMSGMDHGSMQMTSMSMEDMTKELANKSGDEFDKAFLSMMIEHHEGAVDMAKQAQTNAKHEEIKSLSNDIIAAQNREIEQMKDWQMKWGY